MVFQIEDIIVLWCYNDGPVLLGSAVNEEQVGVEGRRRALWNEEIIIKDNQFGVHVIRMCTSGEVFNDLLSL